MGLILADAAPTGAGLAIVAVILLAMLLIVVGILVGIFFLIRRAVRGSRGDGPEPQQTQHPQQ